MAVNQIVEKKGVFEEYSQGMIDEITTIEKELIAELEYLSENIDNTFSACSACLTGLGDVLISSGLFSAKNNRRINVACAIGEGLIEIGSAVTQAMAHNENLDKMMRAKLKYAREKKGMIEVLGPKIEKQHERAKGLLMTLLQEDYNVNWLEQSDNCDAVVVNITKAAMVFKNADYCMRIFNFLMAEFEAWSDGFQFSDVKRPCYRDVNAGILEMSLYDCNPKIVKDLLLPSPQEKTLTGVQLLMLSDDQLAATALQVGTWDNENDLVNSSEIAYLLESEAALPLAQRLLKENMAFTKTVSNLNKTADVLSGSPHIISTIFGLALSALDVWVFFFWLDWSAWIRWPLFAICAWIIGSVWYSWYESETEDHIKQVAESEWRTSKWLLDISGYQKYDTSHLERKSAVMAGLRAAGNFLFGN
ncbi:MAG: hypothetical protein HUJ83_09760 [Veillonella sp.]|nr:hypothetical protein [Veillonella sp.]